MNNTFIVRCIKSSTFGLLLLLVFSACQKEEDIILQNLEDQTIESRSTVSLANTYEANVAIDWYRLTNKLFQNTAGYTPPVASRVLGYIGVGFYEVLLSGKPQHISLREQLSDLRTVSLPAANLGENYHWGIVANSYFKTMISLLFPTTPDAQKAAIAALAQTWEDNFEAQLNENSTTTIIARSKAYGEAMANAIFEWSKTDVIGHEGYLKNFPSDYVLPTGEGKWVPTSSQLIPVQPYWSSVRTFIPQSSNLRLKPHLRYSTATNSAFYREAKQVYTVGNQLTDEQKRIAYYWADGSITPPGHSAAIAIQLIEDRNLNLAQAADVMMKVGVGLADAFIFCWKHKYSYNLLRPVTYIQENIDAAWTPLLTTPVFPEHTSGHSMQSGTTARILAGMFGNTPITDRTHADRTDEPNLPNTYAPRTFRNFYEMANEAANSRLYGGIHYTTGNRVGLEQGYVVGSLVNRLRLLKNKDNS